MKYFLTLLLITSMFVPFTAKADAFPKGDIGGSGQHLVTNCFSLDETPSSIYDLTVSGLDADGKAVSGSWDVTPVCANVITSIFGYSYKNEQKSAAHDLTLPSMSNSLPDSNPVVKVSYVYHFNVMHQTGNLDASLVSTTYYDKDGNVVAGTTDQTTAPVNVTFVAPYIALAVIIVLFGIIGLVAVKRMWKR